MESIESTDWESIGSNQKESVGSNFADSYNSGVEENKRTDEDDHNIFLLLTIFHAQGIDRPKSNTARIYKVESWVEGIRFLCMTPEVFGLPDPKWDWQFCIPLENPKDCKLLHLEVIRTYPKTDPGTSTGEALVGKIQLALPTLSTKIEGLFGLMRPEGPYYKAEGHIYLSMQLIKFQYMPNQLG